MFCGPCEVFTDVDTWSWRVVHSELLGLQVVEGQVVVSPFGCQVLDLLSVGRFIAVAD